MRKSIPRLLLLREFGTQPLAYQWFKSMVDFWNKVAARSSSHPQDWLVLAMRENIQLSFSSGVVPAHVRSSLWAHQFRKVIDSLNGRRCCPVMHPLLLMRFMGLLHCHRWMTARQPRLFTSMFLNHYCIPLTTHARRPQLK
jgi:hypothetical protein